MLIKPKPKKLLTRRNALRSLLAAPAILTLPRGLVAPAKATNYSIAITPSPYGYPGGVPAIASANSLNTQKFLDDFNFNFSGSNTVSGGDTIPTGCTIDLNNTGTAGFNWYPNPNATAAQVNSPCWGLNFGNDFVFPMTVANSVITVGNSSGQWDQLQSAYTGSGVTGAYELGYVIDTSKSFLWEWRMQFPSAGNETDGGPFIGLYSLEFYIGSTPSWVEIDGYEAAYDLYDAFHFWDTANSCQNDAYSQSAPTQDSNWHTYDVLYINNGTTGVVTRYYDGTSYNSYQLWGPGAEYGTEYEAMNSQHALMVLWGNPNGVLNTPVSFDWIGVWQAS